MLGFPGDSDSKESTCNVGDQSVEEKMCTKKGKHCFPICQIVFHIPFIINLLVKYENENFLCKIISMYR